MKDTVLAVERQRLAEEAARRVEAGKRLQEIALAAERQRLVQEAAQRAEVEKRAKEQALALERQHLAEEAAQRAKGEKTAQDAVLAAEKQRLAEEAARRAEEQSRIQEASLAFERQRLAEEASRRAEEQIRQFTYMGPQLTAPQGPTQALAAPSAGSAPEAAASNETQDHEEDRTASAEITWEVTTPPNPKNLFREKVCSANNGSRSCQKAKTIVTKYGFSDVKTKVCRGAIYQFQGTRGGKKFSIKFSALTGALTEILAVSEPGQVIGAGATAAPEVPKD